MQFIKCIYIVGCRVRNESVVACTDTLNAMHAREKVDFFEGRKAMMIFVRTYIQEPGNSEEKLSNLFSFCYVVPSPKRPIRRVIPLTYKEHLFMLIVRQVAD